MGPERPGGSRLGEFTDFLASGPGVLERRGMGSRSSLVEFGSRGLVACLRALVLRGSQSATDLAKLDECEGTYRNLSVYLDIDLDMSPHMQNI